MKTLDANETVRTGVPRAPCDAFDDAVTEANGRTGEGRLESPKMMEAVPSSDWWQTKLIKASDFGGKKWSTN